MQAFRLETGRTIAPLGDGVGACLVLNQPLRLVQEQALAAAGYSLVQTPDPLSPTLVFSDRTWFTAALVRKLSAWAGPGRLVIDDADYLRFTEPLQPGPLEIGVLAAGAAPTLDALLAQPEHLEALGLADLPSPNRHPAFRHALVPIRAGAAMVAGIDHWSHLLKVNLLALAASGFEARAAFDALPAWSRTFRALTVLWRAGSTEPAKIGRALSEIGPRCRIHPTAVVEACRLGADVEVGAFAVVRGSVVGDGARIEEHTYVGLSVVGAGAQVARHTMVNLSVLLPGALVSAGDGFQLCLFGRDSFVARGVTALDLSFGKPISVDHDGERRSSESWFLGVALGHGVRVGAGVRLAYGLAVPNNSLLVAPADDLVRRIEFGEGALSARQGVAVPVTRKEAE